jgi:uroporphyrinogen-III synthase
VERFITGLGPEQISALTASGCRYYAIGPQTAQSMIKHGLAIAATAPAATIPDLVQTVVRDLSTISA